LHQANSARIPQVLQRSGQSLCFWLTEGRCTVQEWNADPGKERLRAPHDKGKIMSTDPSQAPATARPSQSYRSALVSGRKPLRFTFAPDEAARAAIAAELDLLDLPEFTFKGELLPQGRTDVLLKADLTALVVQPCSVTLAPVRSKLTDTTEVRFVHDYVEPAADEWEIPADDSVPLPESIDVAAIAIEALVLALPLYPRARGVEFTEATFAAPGEKPLSSEDLKPFAGLAALADKMKKPEDPKV
jgi:uncharacterized metal-binding protein YceD (DUF177 family)